MIDARAYRVFVQPLAKELGDGFVAYAPALKGCVSDGETPADALANVYDAIDCWIASARMEGQAIPSPEYARQKA